jgi:Legume-like lectin family
VRSCQDNKVSVEIDARNSGAFKTCFKDIPLNLPDGWHKTGYLGLTATTGQLADNHDILSMLVSPKADEVLHDKEVVAPASLPSSGNEQVDALVKAAVAAEIKALEEKLTDLHHLLEHQLSGVEIVRMGCGGSLSSRGFPCA